MGIAKRNTQLDAAATVYLLVVQGFSNYQSWWFTGVKEPRKFNPDSVEKATELQDDVIATLRRTRRANDRAIADNTLSRTDPGPGRRPRPQVDRNAYTLRLATGGSTLRVPTYTKGTLSTGTGRNYGLHRSKSQPVALARRGTPRGSPREVTPADAASGGEGEEEQAHEEKEAAAAVLSASIWSPMRDYAKTTTTAAAGFVRKGAHHNLAAYAPHKLPPRVFGDVNQSSGPAWSCAGRTFMAQRPTESPGPDQYEIGRAADLLSTNKGAPAFSLGVKLKTWKEIERAVG